MATIDDWDGYRHKLVNKIMMAGSYEQIKRFLLTAMKSVKVHEVEEHQVNRFIAKTINQLYGINLLDQDMKLRLNVLYAKSKLEHIQRHREDDKEHILTEITK